MFIWLNQNLIGYFYAIQWMQNEWIMKNYYSIFILKILNNFHFYNKTNNKKKL